MKVALAAFGLLVLPALSGCVRAAEGMVREQAAAAFSCADYAMRVEEVGPDVYRASGCGQELIYACRPAHPRPGKGAGHAAEPPPDPDEVADTGNEPVVVCARRPL